MINSMQKYGVRMQDLADEMGLGIRTIWRWKRGAKRMSLANYLAVRTIYFSMVPKSRRRRNV